MAEPTKTEPTAEQITEQERLYVAGQWTLMWRKFRRHNLAILGGIALIGIYVVAVFCEFFSPYTATTRNSEYLYCQPQAIHFMDSQGKFHLRPFVYGWERDRDPETLRLIYTVDKSKIYPIRLFVRGEPYKLWGFIRSDLHFYGVNEGVVYLFGTDRLGRDMVSRNLYAARISLSVGLLGITFSFILGITLGGISGYFGGTIDMIIQRIIEFLMSIPTIPLWMALSAAMPEDWNSIQMYFAITIILSLINWRGLARVVRSKLLELREEDFVMAAKILGAGAGFIIGKHLLPSFMSYLIVNLTLAVPRIILAETSLSFLGLGIRAPAVSWGSLLKDAQNIRTVALHPWLLVPGLLVIVTVLTFNFLGDGLRDAADPYK